MIVQVAPGLVLHTDVAPELIGMLWLLTKLPYGCLGATPDAVAVPPVLVEFGTLGVLATGAVAVGSPLLTLVFAELAACSVETGFLWKMYVVFVSSSTLAATITTKSISPASLKPL